MEKKGVNQKFTSWKKTPARGILIISYVHCNTGRLVCGIAWTARAGNGTHCSHTFNMVLEWLAETVWWNKWRAKSMNPSSLDLCLFFYSSQNCLNISPHFYFFYCRLSRSQSLIRLFDFRYGPNTCSHCTCKEWHRGQLFLCVNRNPILPYLFELVPTSNKRPF